MAADPHDLEVSALNRMILDIDPEAEMNVTQDLDAEFAILTLLDRTGTRDYRTDPDAQAAAAGICEAVQPDDFLREFTSKLFCTMRDVYRELGFVNRVVVSARMKAANPKHAQAYDQGFVPLYLEAASVETEAWGKLWREYAARLRDCASRRKARTILEQAFLRISTPGPDDADAILRQAISDLSMARPEYSKPLTTVGEYIGNGLFAELQASRDTQGGWKTGWTVFDREFLPRGFVPGRITVLMAPRKTGKSAVCAQLFGALGLAGARVALATLEMSQAEVAVRMISQQTAIASTRIELDELDEYEREQVTEQVRLFGGTSMVISDQRDRDIHGLLHWFRRVKEQFGLDVAFVDYLQLLRPHLSGRETMERNISDAFRKLLVGAQELGCHVICLSQLAPDGKAKWSGQTNDDAHFNWTIMRCNASGQPDPEGDSMKFLVSQRFGKSGLVPRVYAYHAESGYIQETHVNPLPERRQDGGE